MVEYSDGDAGDAPECDNCRFWSEMIAEASAATGSIKAICLNAASPHAGLMMLGREVCPSWARNALGAIDDPSWRGEDPMQAYAKFDRGETP